MTIRPATAEDASAISALIGSLAHHFLVHADGSQADAFLMTLTAESIERKIASAELDYYVSVFESQMTGVISVRGGTHLFHLFVSEDFQRKGIAYALWTHVKNIYGWSSSEVPVTVNSTPIGVPFYEYVGFRQAGPRAEKNGVAYIPMQLAVMELNSLKE
ncbi:GNAT family N-acetyltransferase [Herbaspirillum sp.]|uniref:GNAT family N-acetyltransferase n=1 Tax=Herbaspirillum sp. TaxID=1890675 RepID=UPI001B18E25C|nr:GNAT family N-acetyltransferase [Herbaspirillum sp.]MBO9537868.1 GNAT family N-acetyltransferase [Herbaspirillum sp.]